MANTYRVTLKNAASFTTPSGTKLLKGAPRVFAEGDPQIDYFNSNSRLFDVAAVENRPSTAPKPPRRRRARGPAKPAPESTPAAETETDEVEETTTDTDETTESEETEVTEDLEAEEAPESEEATGDDDDDDEETDDDGEVADDGLDDLSRTKLTKMARGMGLSVPSKLDRDDIVALIRENSGTDTPTD